MTTRFVATPPLCQAVDCQERGADVCYFPPAPVDIAVVLCPTHAASTDWPCVLIQPRPPKETKP